MAKISDIHIEFDILRRRIDENMFHQKRCLDDLVDNIFPISSDIKDLFERMRWLIQDGMMINDWFFKLSLKFPISQYTSPSKHRNITSCKDKRNEKMIDKTKENEWVKSNKRQAILEENKEATKINKISNDVNESVVDLSNND